MRVLVACEYSGRVREAFRKLGHDAWSCDILLAEDGSPYHIQGDVLGHLDEGWDLMIAHPPCTYFARAGMQYLHTQPGRKEKLEQSYEFWLKLWNAPIGKIAMENPVGWLSTHFQKPDQIIHPYYFGEPAHKETCLWLKNLPLLVATDMLPKPKPLAVITRKGSYRNGQNYYRHWRDGKSAHDRSRTFECIANAMAQQWGAALDGEKV